MYTDSYLYNYNTECPVLYDYIKDAEQDTPDKDSTIPDHQTLQMHLLQLQSKAKHFQFQYRCPYKRHLRTHFPTLSYMQRRRSH